MLTIWSNNTELQWCTAVPNSYTCYHQLYRLVPVQFTPCSAISVNLYSYFLHLFSNFIQLVPVLFFITLYAFFEKNCNESTQYTLY